MRRSVLSLVFAALSSAALFAAAETHRPVSELRRLIVAASGVPEPVVIEERFARKVDGFVRTDGANWMFGSFALSMPGGTAAVVRATFNLPAAKGRALFALDMKSGRRVPFDGTLEYLQRPGEVCNYLIGDGAFTSWYEGVTYGENLLTWAIGMNFKEHKRKVQLLYGGFGTPVKFPETKRNAS